MDTINSILENPVHASIVIGFISVIFFQYKQYVELIQIKEDLYEIKRGLENAEIIKKW